MSDTWDGGYEDSIDDGHEFAEKELLLPGGPFEDEGGMGVTFDDPRSEKLDKGVVPARFAGTCVVCEAPIGVGDPITGQGVNGWRHAGCLGEQVVETQYTKNEAASNEFLMKTQAEEERRDL